MKMIFHFVSRGPSRLSAFTGEGTGTSLPERHGPWQIVDEIGPNRALPHALDRRAVERAIGEVGYQLWRMKQADVYATDSEDDRVVRTRGNAQRKRS